MTFLLILTILVSLLVLLFIFLSFYYRSQANKSLEKSRSASVRVKELWKKPTTAEELLNAESENRKHSKNWENNSYTQHITQEWLVYATAALALIEIAKSLFQLIKQNS
jgi:Ca2+/Na+ antiporter